MPTGERGSDPGGVDHPVASLVDDPIDHGRVDAIDAADRRDQVGDDETEQDRGADEYRGAGQQHDQERRHGVPPGEPVSDPRGRAPRSRVQRAVPIIVGASGVGS